MGIYDITVLDRNEQPVSLSAYKGKVLLIVNTATGCGFTPQYKGLQALYDQYREQGLEILDFPCNQFAGQAPGSDETIHQFCTLNYGTTFPRFHKIKVNGKDADPLFQYLKKEQKGELGRTDHLELHQVSGRPRRQRSQALFPQDHALNPLSRISKRCSGNYIERGESIVQVTPTITESVLLQKQTFTI